MSACLLINEIYTNQIDLKFQKRTTSSLRIPIAMMEEFKSRVNKNGGVDRYFMHVLNKFRLFNYSGLVPPASKVKTEYQLEGIGYVKVNFEPSNSAWLELGALALFYGKSRCWLFTFLLSLDFAGFGEVISQSFHGVPSLGGSLLFTGTFLQPHKALFTRAMRVKPPDYRETPTEKPTLFGLLLE